MEKINTHNFVPILEVMLGIDKIEFDDTSLQLTKRSKEFMNIKSLRHLKDYASYYQMPSKDYQLQDGHCTKKDKIAPTREGEDFKMIQPSMFGENGCRESCNEDANCSAFEYTY